MDEKIKARLVWVELYESTKDAGFVCRKCGISRPTLRKWFRRYQQHGIDGLQELSRRPKRSPNKKIDQQQEELIKELRQRRLGTRRIQSELIRLHDIRLSRASLHKVLVKQAAPPLKKSRRVRKTKNRYERPVPGDRVQIDTCQIATDLIQYTAIDDCTRIKVVALYPSKSADNSLLFLEYVLEELPFPIQRIQTDRGREFFAYEFQQRLMDYGIKFRPIKPRSPHLNGKVEGTQKTDWEEFYSVADLTSPDLQQQLIQWQDYYNHYRPHGSLNNKTPWEKWQELTSVTPINEEVEAMYDPAKERIRLQNYRDDLELKRLTDLQF